MRQRQRDRADRRGPNLRRQRRHTHALQADRRQFPGLHARLAGAPDAAQRDVVSWRAAKPSAPRH